MPVIKTRKCPRCHGRGYLKGCPKCKGRREIVVKRSNGAEPMNSSLQKLQEDFQADFTAASAIDEQREADLAAKDATIQGLQKQLAAIPKIPSFRKPTVHAGLHCYQLFTADKKIPFQWIQPGNVGNTGGGSSAAHGSETWKVIPGQPTEIAVTPKNIAPKSDDFFNYMILPYPSAAPNRFRFTAGNYGTKTDADWSKCQQLECQIEEFRDGFQYTCAWACNPHTGMMYWAGAKKWQPFIGGSAIKAFISPNSFIAEFSLDHDAHTYTYEWIYVNGQMLQVGITIPCVAARPDRKEFSISVQPDCQASASPYVVLLDDLFAEWQ